MKEILFGARDSELEGFEYIIPKGFEAEIKDGKVIVRKAESEDEKIRKEIVNFICWATDRGSITSEQREKSNSWLAWLEKQGKNNMGISEATKQELEDNLNKALAVETGESWNEFLEKQGEQKPDNVMWHKIQPKEYVLEKTLIIKKNGELDMVSDTILSVTDAEYALPVSQLPKPKSNVIQGEQKPADKVEPKFHEGDWIVHHGTENIYQVVAVIDNQYQLKYCETYTVQKCSDVERCARLWDITKDAKDGDVLCCESGWTCIFKALDNHTNTFSSYCFMDSDKWFCNTGSEGHTLDKAFIKAYNGEIHPATKEQRDLLFQKMKEAGYEWDVEKKELKKIEQKHAEWSEEDENLLTDTEYLLRVVKMENRSDNEYQRAETCLSWLKSLKDRCLPQPKQEWSEEDEKMYNVVHDLAWESYKTSRRLDIPTFGIINDWFNSLKDRVQPQPKQEWSEEDEFELECILGHLREYLHEDAYRGYERWLKSLRPQSTWKPTGEQINALSKVLQYYGDVNQNAHNVKKLLEQLKAL